MAIKSVSVEAIDFNNLKPEDVFKWLEKFGFKRRVSKKYIIPSKGENPQLIWPDESPEGLYTSVIVPEFNLGKTLFIISMDQLDRIREAFESQYMTKSAKEGEL